MAHTDPQGNPFPELKNDCILRAARGEPTEHVPVWIMRQAGRYLPEFRELRQKHPFFQLCETPHLACEVSLMPIRRFELDAAIIFSDILVIPQALGLEVVMTSGEGPKFPEPLKQGESLASRLTPDVCIRKRLSQVYQAITMTRHALEGKCPLIGFAGAPWTLMCYMIEGGGSKTMSKAKKWLYQEPQVSAQLLSLIAEKVTDHLVEQVRAGAQMVQLFESNAEYLTYDLFKEFALPQIVSICTNLKARLDQLNIERVPIIVFAKGGHYAMDLLNENALSGIIDVISLDWTMDPIKMRQLAGGKTCLQGNLDPCALYADADKIEIKTREMLRAYGTQRYIANLGHGIYPDADFEHVKIFIDLVHRLSREQNSNKQS